MLEEKKKEVLKNFIKSDLMSLASFLIEESSDESFTEKEILDYDKQKEWIVRAKNEKQKTKNQHYVPQFYLNKFTNENGKLETLNVREKVIMKPQSPQRVCSGSYFYSIEKGEYDDISQILEDYLKFYEDDFASIYDKLHDDILRYKPIDEDILYRLCVYVYVSMSRTKKFREFIEQSDEDIMKKIMKMKYQMMKHHNPDNEMIKKIIGDEQTEKMIEEGSYSINFLSNKMHIERITKEENIRGFANLLFGMKMRIYISDGERDFVTSDNPAFELVPEIRTFYGYTFVQRYHYFVLSNKILIEFSDPNSPGKQLKRKRLNKGEVMYYNLLRSMYSDYIYSGDQRNLHIDDYTEARMNYIDRLFNLFPTDFGKEKEYASNMKVEALKHGFIGKSNYELYKIFRNRGRFAD